MVRFIEGTLVWAQYLVGDWDASLRSAYEFVAECEAGSPHYQEAGVRSLRGHLRHARGDSQGGLEDTARAVELGREAKDPQILLSAVSARALVCAELGRIGEGRELAAEVMSAVQGPSARRFGAVTDLVWVADELGLRNELREQIRPVARESKWTEAAMLLLDGEGGAAADLYAGMGAVTPEADARRLAGRALIPAGRRGAGEIELRRALDFYRRVGATRYIGECEELLG